MFRKIVSLVVAAVSVALLGCGDGIAHYPDHDGIPNNCEYTDAEYYRPAIFARFDNNYRRVVLVDWTTAETVDELATSVDAANVEILSWSPNCRYLTVRQDGDGVIYDVTNGGLLGVFPDVPPFGYNTTSVTWDSTSSFVTVETGKETILKNIATGAQVMLAPYHFLRQYWDLPTNQVIAVSSKGVKAFDLTSGAEVAQFEGAPTVRSMRVAFSPDHSLITFYDGYHTASTWNRNTMGRTDINIGHFNFDPVIAISSDNRYLAVGSHSLQIWDLQNPPQDVTAHTPLYQYTDAAGWSVIKDLHFIDGTTIEINDGHRMNWNFINGEQAS